MKYKTKSWSEQARAKADSYYEIYKNDIAIIEPDLLDLLRNSYRHKRIIFRTAKRLGRLIRKGKR